MARSIFHQDGIYLSAFVDADGIEKIQIHAYEIIIDKACAEKMVAALTSWITHNKVACCAEDPRRAGR